MREEGETTILFRPAHSVLEKKVCGETLGGLSDGEGFQVEKYFTVATRRWTRQKPHRDYITPRQAHRDCNIVTTMVNSQYTIEMVYIGRSLVS